MSPPRRHPPLPGVILAGGRSSRMGRDKATATLGGKPLLQRAIERLRPQTAGLVISSNSPRDLAFASGIAIVPDTRPDHAGPMAGVLAAMRSVEKAYPAASHVVTVPTDTPFFPHDLVAGLQTALMTPDQIAVASSAGSLHPVFALWPIDLADDLETWLANDDKRRVRGFIERHSAVTVDFPLLDVEDMQIDPFFNINTAADLEIAERWLTSIEGNAQ